MFVWELLVDLLVRFVEVVVFVVCGELKMWRNGFVYLRGKVKKKNLVFNIDSFYYELCVLCFVLWCFRDFIVVSCVVFGLYGFGVLFELIILDCLL